MKLGSKEDNNDEAKAQIPVRERSGWAFMEDYTMKHDSTLVKDLSDDIDTMLVFAGLFSAVVTTLVGVSFLLLQQDSTVPVLQRLDRISTQLERLSFTSSSGYLNSTLPTVPLQSSSYIPTGSSRWVNVLWFLSLVLSLAAALFGILAKQWLREYIKWNAALGTPRENLLVRQIRFEAWNDWNVTATISFIPALLELALVMFLLGLLVFLWSLDPVVAIVITVAITIVILITIALTVAPAFWKRCPYKSPTAWAVVILCNFINGYLIRLRKLAFRFKEALRSAAASLVSSLTSITLAARSPSGCLSHIRFFARSFWQQMISISSHLKNLLSIVRSPNADHDASPEPNPEPIPTPGAELNPEYDSTPSPYEAISRYTWRERDLEGSHGRLPHIEDAYYWEDLSDPRSTIWAAEPPKKVAVGRQREICAEICDDSTLFRALSWVSHASQDPSINRHIALCTETLQDRMPRDKVALSARMLSLWNLLRECRPPSTRPSLISEGSPSLGRFISVSRTTLWNTFGIIQPNPSITILQDEPPQNPELCKKDVNFGHCWSLKEHEIVLRLVLHTVVGLTEALPAVSNSDAFNRRLLELLYLAHAITPDPFDNPIFTEFIKRLVDAYNVCYKYEAVPDSDIGVRGRNKDYGFSGRRSSLIQFIWQFARVEIRHVDQELDRNTDDSLDLLRLPRGREVYQEWSLSITDDLDRPTLESFLAHRILDSEAEANHLALIIVNRAIMEGAGLSRRPRSSPDMMQLIAGAVEDPRASLISLLKGDASFQENGGSYASRVWTNFMVNIAYSHQWNDTEVFDCLHRLVTEGRATNLKMICATLRVRSWVSKKGATVIMGRRFGKKPRERYPRLEVFEHFEALANEDSAVEILKFELDSEWGPNRRDEHHVVWHIDEWFNSLRHRKSEDTGRVLEKILAITTTAQQRSLHNCGCVDPLPWYDSLVARAYAVIDIIIGEDDSRAIFARLLETLSKSVHDGLMSGSAVAGIPKLSHVYSNFPPSLRHGAPYFRLLHGGFADSRSMFAQAQGLPLLTEEITSDPEMRHAYVWFANEWLQSPSLAGWLGTHEQRCSHSIGGVIRWMKEMVRLSIDDENPNCGFTSDLPWVSTFVAVDCHVARILDAFCMDSQRSMWCIDWFDNWRNLWDNLLLAKRKGLVTGPGVQMIPRLWHMVHTDLYFEDDDDFAEFIRTAELIDEEAQSTPLPPRTQDESEEDSDSEESAESSE